MSATPYPAPSRPSRVKLTVPWQLFHGLMQPLGYTVPAIILGGLFLRHVLNVKLFPSTNGMTALFSRNDSP